MDRLFLVWGRCSAGSSAWRSARSARTPCAAGDAGAGRDVRDRRPVPALARPGAGRWSSWCGPGRRTRRPPRSRAVAFIVGMLLFSGSLFLLVWLDRPRLGAITPIGGVALLIGWAALRRAPCSRATSCSGRSSSAPVPDGALGPYFLWASSLALLVGVDDLVGEVRGHLLVVVERHREHAPPAGHRPQVDRVARHLGLRHRRAAPAACRRRSTPCPGSCRASSSGRR